MNKFFVLMLALGLTMGIQHITIAEEVVPAVEEGMDAVVTDDAAGDMMAAAEEAMEMYEGTVVSADESGKVVIKYVADPETQTESDVDFWVKENSILVKNDQPVTLADVAAGDKVAFAYTTNEEGGKVISHLQVVSAE